MHKDTETIQKLIDGDSKGDPLYDFTAVDGVRHTVWRVEEYAPYIAAYKGLGAAYVADGHHRSASAARAGKERRDANPNHTGEEEYNWFLTVLFPAKQLNILPYNRYVKDLNGMTPEDLISRIATVAQIEKDVAPQPRSTGCFGMYLDGQWYSITLPAGSIDHDDPVGSLDYQLLYDRILAPLLGIGDIRKDERIDFVGGIRGTGELKKRVDKDGGVAFAMHAVTIDKKGDLFFNRDRVSPEELDQRLQEVAADPNQPTLYLAVEAGGEVDRSQQLIDLLRRVQQAGVPNVAVVGQPTQQSP